MERRCSLSRAISIVLGGALALSIQGSCALAAGLFGMECPPPGYDGNQDCGYECGEGGTCCGNPHYYGSYVFGTWHPDPRCVAGPSTRQAPGQPR
jgi:hypothetical protein